MSDSTKTEDDFMIPNKGVIYMNSKGEYAVHRLIYDSTGEVDNFWWTNKLKHATVFHVEPMPERYSAKFIEELNQQTVAKLSVKRETVITIIKAGE